MIVTVRIEQWDLSRPRPFSSMDCPLAAAVNRVRPYGVRVAVSRDRLIVLGVAAGVLPGNAASLEIPFEEDARAWVAAYDANPSAARPASFRFEFPDPPGAKT